MKICVTLLMVIAGGAGAMAQDFAVVDRFAAGPGPYVADAGETGQRGTGILYSRTTETASRFNPGVGGTPPGSGLQQDVMFDDVPIPFSRLGGNTSIAVSRVTVGVRRLANAPAVDVSLFFSTATSGTVAPDTALDVPFNNIATVSLLANGATAVTTLVTLGDGINPLFTVALNTTLLTPDFGTFFLGMQFSNADNLNGWRVTSGPDANANAVWLFDSDNANPEGAFTLGGVPTAAFYIEIEGTPVPAPGALALLGLGGLTAVRRRR